MQDPYLVSPLHNVAAAFAAGGRSIFDNNINVPGILRIVDPDDVISAQRLLDAFVRVVQPHEALRTGLGMGGMHWTQRVYHPDDVELDDLRVTRLEVNPDDPIADMVALVQEGVTEPFDLTQAPLWRASFAKTPDGWVIGWVFNHTVMDGTSLEVLAKSFAWALRVDDEPHPSVYQPRQIAEDERAAVISRKAMRFWADLYAKRWALSNGWEGNVGELLSVPIAGIPKATIDRLKALSGGSTTMTLAAIGTATVTSLIEHPVMFGLAEAHREEEGWQGTFGACHDHLPFLPFADRDWRSATFAQWVAETRESIARSRRYTFPTGVLQLFAGGATTYDCAVNLHAWRRPEPHPVADTAAFVVAVPVPGIPISHVRSAQSGNPPLGWIARVEGASVEASWIGYSLSVPAEDLQECATRAPLLAARALANPDTPLGDLV